MHTIKTITNHHEKLIINPTHKPSNWLELSKTAFSHNIGNYKAIIGPNRIVAAVVKSNAYGHGTNEIAPWCQENNSIDWICTAQLSEAIQLRKLGITKPLLVLYTIDTDAQAALDYSISLMVGNRPTLQHLESSSNKAYAVHIKIDTGMSRFGFSLAEIPALISELKQCKHIYVQGIYTHFADADNKDQSYTQAQLELFYQAIDLFTSAGFKIPFIHCANTAATSTIDMPLTNFFRIGAGIYGLWPSLAVQEKTAQLYPDFSLKQVATWKTYIHQLRTIAAGNYVSYSKTYQTTKTTTVALLPVGYHDGYHRRLSNAGIVLINGVCAPVIGRVAMNATCIDVTHIPTAQPGDEVILLGNHPGITALDMANTLGSFNPREVTVRFNAALPRIIT
jgi:alanine racemase